MKKLLGIIGIVFALNFAAFSAERTLVGYWSGAWFETSAPKGAVRTAGQIDIYQWSDGSLDYDLYFDGDVFQSGTGTWTRTAPTKEKVEFHDDGGTFSYRRFFKGQGSDAFWSGTFSITTPTGRFKGKWQAT